MSDLHALPLAGRDLPEESFGRVRVFKDHNRWCYYHWCEKSYRYSYRYWSWEDAYAGALRHRQWCGQ